MMKHIINFFNVYRPWDIVWAHAVNSKNALTTALASSDVMMLEGDVYQNTNGEVIMAHPPITESDLTFEEWFDHILKTKKGAKLDFKSLEAVEPCLQYMKTFTNLDIPIFLNQDVVDGPYNIDPIPDPLDFIAKCNSYFPNAILSLGFSIERPIPGKKEEFTEDMYKKMLEIASNWNGHVTICLCSSFLIESHHLTEKYLENTQHSYTLWNYEPVSAELGAWITQHFNPEKTFYDFKTPDNGVHRLE
jgi:hypothetical protein